MYDAACILEILQQDAQMLKMLDGYYKEPARLPWNRRHELVGQEA
jgi:hypothetical protein